LLSLKKLQRKNPTNQAFSPDLSGSHIGFLINLNSDGLVFVVFQNPSTGNIPRLPHNFKQNLMKIKFF
jgi:hypothetical protein